MKITLLAIAFSMVLFPLMAQLKTFMELTGNSDEISSTRIFNTYALMNEDYAVNFTNRLGFNVYAGLNGKVFNHFIVETGMAFNYRAFTKKVELPVFYGNTTTWPTNETPTPPATYNYDLAAMSELMFSSGDVTYSMLSETPAITNTASAQSDNGQTRIGYLSVPIRLYYSLFSDKLRIGVGVVNAFVAFSSEVKYAIPFAVSTTTSTDNIYGSRFRTDDDATDIPRATLTDVILDDNQVKYTDKSGDGFNNYQLYGNALIQFNFWNKLWLTADYAHGFLSIYDEKKNLDEARFKSYSLGIRCYW